MLGTMLELLTGAGLASAAGLNAGLPLLVLGALARWTGLVELPVGWTWLADDRVLVLLGVLVVLDVVADKVPGLDHVNDLVQTVVRPTAGGLAFGAGVGAQTVAVAEPGTSAPTWVAVGAGVALALVVHAFKALARPLVNASTAGLGGPVVSVLEDATSLALTVAAILLPLLVLVLLALLVVAGVRAERARRRRRARRRTEERVG
jgi:hypothetical protein